MPIDAFIIVGLIVVAICAGDLLGGIDGVVIRHEPSLDRMVIGLVAICAEKVVSTHVNVCGLGGIVKAFVQVSMFDVVAAAPVEMAGSASWSGRVLSRSCAAASRSVPSAGLPYSPLE